MSPDPLGLIAATGRVSATAADEFAPQESYLLVPLRRPARCARCERVGHVSLVLGLADVVICDDCDPLATTVAAISDLIDFGG
jgi:hypothetical protein